jgi:hypothetical protein
MPRRLLYNLPVKPLPMSANSSRAEGAERGSHEVALFSTRGAEWAVHVMYRTGRDDKIVGRTSRRSAEARMEGRIRSSSFPIRTKPPSHLSCAQRYGATRYRSSRRLGGLHMPDQVSEWHPCLVPRQYSHGIECSKESRTIGVSSDHS